MNVEFLKDWRILIFFYIVCTGIWGVVQKFASMKLNTLTLSFVSITSALLVVSIASLKELQFDSKEGILTAALGGALGGMATIAFYGALRRAPANIVIPLSSLSIVITVILSHFVLKETIGMRQVVGIVFGMFAIFLLSK